MFQARWDPKIQGEHFHESMMEWFPKTPHVVTEQQRDGSRVTKLKGWGMRDMEHPAHTTAVHTLLRGGVTGRGAVHTMHTRFKMALPDAKRVVGRMMRAMDRHNTLMKTPWHAAYHRVGRAAASTRIGSMVGDISGTAVPPAAAVARYKRPAGYFASAPGAAATSAELPVAKRAKTTGDGAGPRGVSGVIKSRPMLAGNESGVPRDLYATVPPPRVQFADGTKEGIIKRGAAQFATPGISNVKPTRGAIAAVITDQRPLTATPAGRKELAERLARLTQYGYQPLASRTGPKPS